MGSGFRPVTQAKNGSLSSPQVLCFSVHLQSEVFVANLCLNLFIIQMHKCPCCFLMSADAGGFTSVKSRQLWDSCQMLNWPTQQSFCVQQKKNQTNN